MCVLYSCCFQFLLPICRSRNRPTTGTTSIKWKYLQLYSIECVWNKEIEREKDREIERHSIKSLHSLASISVGRPIDCLAEYILVPVVVVVVAGCSVTTLWRTWQAFRFSLMSITCETCVPLTVAVVYFSVPYARGSCSPKSDHFLLSVWKVFHIQFATNEMVRMHRAHLRSHKVQ